MTINEAIKELEPYVFTDEELPPTIRRYSEALSMAIEALKTVQEHKGTFEWCVECKEFAEVVRCKDCKYLGIKDLVYGYCKYRMTGIVMPDDYCSHGERREP